MQPKRFSDFARELTPLDGAKLKIDSIVNKEILVTGVRLKTSKFKSDDASRCLTLQFELEGQRYVIFTGSSVLIGQAEKYEQEIPFVATIKKIDRYYTLS